MTPTLTVDATRFNDQMARIRDALIGKGKMADAATVVRDEARLLLKQIMRFTPPFKAGKSPAPTDEDQGARAVARDIKRAMTPIDLSKVKDARLRKIFADGDNEEFKTFQKHSGKFIGWRIEKFNPAILHAKQRDRRGRINSEKKVYVTEAQKVATYIASKQRNVGLMRSGWAPAARTLGLKLPMWVARHSRNPGFTINQLDSQTVPSVTIGNVARGIGQIRHAVQSALNTRVNAMRRKIKLILSGYAKDVARGIKVSRKARTIESD